jgi:hypothetical protein
MRRPLIEAILLLYPSRVRSRHGPEMMALVDDLAAHDGRSRARLFMRLAVDGLIERLISTATVWTLAAVLALTSFGGMVLSDLAAASAHQRVAGPARTVAPALQGAGSAPVSERERPGVHHHRCPPDRASCRPG